jgi:hypothetical protein
VTPPDDAGGRSGRAGDGGEATVRGKTVRGKTVRGKTVRGKTL